MHVCIKYGLLKPMYVIIYLFFINCVFGLVYCYNLCTVYGFSACFNSHRGFISMMCTDSGSVACGDVLSS